MRAQALPRRYTSVRQLLRSLLVAAVAVVALAMSLPNLYAVVRPAANLFDFWTASDVVVLAGPHARAAGIRVGDRVDYPTMPENQRFGDVSDGHRAAPIGLRVRLELLSGNQRRGVILAPEEAQPPTAVDLAVLVCVKAGFFMLVLLSCALLLIRPARITVAFFLFVVGHAHVAPYFYSFLPAAGYAAIMVMNDLLSALGPVGYALLAIALSVPSLHRPRTTALLAALAVLVIALPGAVSDTHELLVGTRPAWPLWGWSAFGMMLALYAFGAALFLRLTIRSTEPRAVRLIALLLCAVGATTAGMTTINAHSDAWYFANLPSAASTRAFSSFTLKYGAWAFVLRLLASLGIAYVFVRERIVDTGPVISRIAAYIVWSLAAVVVLLLLNVALAPQLASHSIVLPLELALAVIAGYRFSGLRDVAEALSLSVFDAANAWGNAKLDDERDALTRALGLAERTRQKGLIAEVRAHCAFSAWCRGDDQGFKLHAAAVTHELGSTPLRGLLCFAAVSLSDSNEMPFEPTDLPEWKARTALVAGARASDATAAQRLAESALQSAKEAAVPWLHILALVNFSETNPFERESALETAHVIARDAGWSAVSKSILAFRANARDIGALAPFVNVRVRKRRSADSIFEVSFSDAELRTRGTTVPLPEKELELLFTVAATQLPLNGTQIIDTMWPEADGDAAANAFRVCLHRLRKHAGDPRIVQRIGKGYALHPWAEVDLWNIHALLDDCARDVDQARLAALRSWCAKIRAGAARRASLGEWFYRFEERLRASVERADAILTQSTVSAPLQRKT